MPKSIPPYEKRQRWLAAISASLQPIDVFPFAKYRALQAVDLIDDLEAEIADIERRLSSYITQVRLMAFWKDLLHVLKTMVHGYYEILNRLADHEWTGWTHTEGDPQTRKQSTIKRLAIYDWILSVLGIAIKSSFEEFRPWFLTTWPKDWNSTHSPRRSSCPEARNVITPEGAERAAVDSSILRWTQSLEGELRSTMCEVQKEYDNGKVFEYYVNHLQWTYEEERQAREDENLETGHVEHYRPVPSIALKPAGLDMPEAKACQRHLLPHGGVPTWQEDEELKAIFS